MRARLQLVHFPGTVQSVYRHDAVGMDDVDFASLVLKFVARGLEREPVREIISRGTHRDISRSIEMLVALAK